MFHECWSNVGYKVHFDFGIPSPASLCFALMWPLLFLHGGDMYAPDARLTDFLLSTNI